MNTQMRVDGLGQTAGDDETYREAMDDLDEELALLAGVPKSIPFRVGSGRNSEAAIRDMIRNADKENSRNCSDRNEGAMS